MSIALVRFVVAVMSFDLFGELPLTWHGINEPIDYCYPSENLCVRPHLTFRCRPFGAITSLYITDVRAEAIKRVSPSFLSFSIFNFVGSHFQKIDEAN